MDRSVHRLCLLPLQALSGVNIPVLWMQTKTAQEYEDRIQDMNRLWKWGWISDIQYVLSLVIFFRRFEYSMTCSLQTLLIHFDLTLFISQHRGQPSLLISISCHPDFRIDAVNDVIAVLLMVKIFLCLRLVLREGKREVSWRSLAGGAVSDRIWSKRR